MAHPVTTIKAKAVDLGELVLGDVCYALVELEVVDEGKRRNGKAGTVNYRHAALREVLVLEGTLPVELATELRRHVREAETEATGATVVAGLEGWLDSAGVVVTDADTQDELRRREGLAPIDRDERDLFDPARGWVSLGERVNYLRTYVETEGTEAGKAEARNELDALFVELNGVTDGDIVEDNVIIDIDGEERPVLELPDFEPAPSEVTTANVADIKADAPWDGYDDLTIAQVVEHIVDYLDADRALGGPTHAAARYVSYALSYERVTGGRARVVTGLEAALKTITAAIGDEQVVLEEATLEHVGPEHVNADDAIVAGVELPWDRYDTSTADSIIGHLKAIADVDVEQARELIATVDAFESSHKKRKGVLGRLAGIVPPPMPDGPDLEVEVDDDDDFEPTEGGPDDEGGDFDLDEEL